jgi:hypothetical protein
MAGGIPPAIFHLLPMPTEASKISGPSRAFVYF